MRAEEMIGKKYGRLLVQSYEVITIKGRKRTYMFCRCDCGSEIKARSDSLLSGKIVSCGCKKKEQAREQAKVLKIINRKHGKAGTRIYKIWVGMKSRCYCKKGGSYKHYGAKGIKVCDEWKTSFDNFLEWSKKNGYADNLTIDRIDSQGNYEPSNCRWVSNLEQQNNKCNNRYITYKGITKTATQWSREKGFRDGVLISRLKAGWSIDKALNTPINIKKSRYRNENC